MDTLDVAVLGATIMLFALGIRAMLTKTEPGDPPPMGCGYGIVAGALLAYQFRDELGSWGNGMRLWAGVALILPGLKALIRPQGKSLPVAIIAFLLAILIAFEPAKRLYNRANGIEEPISKEEQLDKMENARSGLDDLHEVLASKAANLKMQIKELGINKDEILAHPDGEKRLAQLQAVLERMVEIDERKVTLDRGIEDLSIELKQLEIAGEVAGFDHLDPEFREVLREIEDIDAEISGSTIEEYMKREELGDLASDVLGGK